MTYTYACVNCLRVFILPMLRESDERMGIAPKTDHYILTCVCGTENRYPLMAVLPYPIPKEVPV